MHCLICGDAIVHARMSVNACRACAAFYKRSCALGEKQLCCRDGLNKCHDTNPKTSCRRCRFMRFREVLAKAANESTSLQPSISAISQQQREAAADFDSAFIDHTGAYECGQSTSAMLCLRQLQHGYSHMCLMRRAAETAASLSQRRAAAGSSSRRSGQEVFHRATYSSMMPFIDMTRQATKECAALAFPDFRMLNDDERDLLISNSFAVLNALDATYRTCHYFPDDLKIRLASYTTYLSSTDLDDFLAECEDVIDTRHLKTAMRSSFETGNKRGREHFQQRQPTAPEFLALFGLALWRDDASISSEQLLSIARSNRAEIVADLHRHYAARGVADYASRLGSLFCLLDSFQNITHKTVEDFQVFRLMKMFETTFVTETPPK